MPALLAHKDEVPEHLPKISVPELEALPALALGTKYVFMLADRTTPADEPQDEDEPEPAGE